MSDDGESKMIKGKKRFSQHSSDDKLAVIYCSDSCMYTQLQKKLISHFSGQLWKSELRNENIFIPYAEANSSASFN